MRTCSERIDRTQLHALADQVREEKDRAMSIDRANDAAGAKGGPVRCAGCGATLLPGPLGYSCTCTSVTTLAAKEYNAMAARLRHIRSQADQLRHRRHRAAQQLFASAGAAHINSWFRTYKPGTDSQRRAMELARGFVGLPWCLVLSGPPGVGKSHLMAARWRLSARRMVRKVVELPVFISEAELAKAWRAAFRDDDGRPDEILDYYSGERVLYLDDLGVVSATSSGWLAAMGRLIEFRERHQLATFITTNLTSQQIAGLYGERVASRLASGLSVRVDGPDQRLQRTAAMGGATTSGPAESF